MCGIVGYVGEREAIEVLVNGLSKLEYRGYDSAGVAVIEDKQIKVKKCKGRLKNLEAKLKEKPLMGNIGIGHTRWATHGEPSDINSHPHSNETITISVVHNGIIENYAQLKQWLKDKGYKFSSETDTEVIPNLLDYYYAGDLLDAVIKVTSKLEGSYAIGVMCNNEPDKVVAVRKDSPLIVGVGKDEYFIASDIPAILNYTRDIYYLDDKEFVVLDKKGVNIYSEDREVINKDISHITWSVDAAEKDGYEDFMLKEIHEQPRAIRDTMKSRIVLNNPINLDDIKLTKEDLDKIDRIYIVACGTAYNAGIIGKNVIEKLARISVETDIASEFRYKDHIITKDTLVIVLSQSGETADTLAVLRDSKAKGAKTIAVTNVVGSSIAREAHNVLYTWAGPEIAVASTKAYVTQLIILYSIALHLADLRETISNEEIEKIKTEMLLLLDKVQRILDNKEEIQKFASKHYNEKDMYFLGRGMDYGVAMEAALKLKEISYIHSEAYAGGELKHGTIALIEKGIVVVALFTQEKLVDKMVSNIQEVLTRGAEVLGVMCEKDSYNKELIESKIIIPDTLDILTPVLSVVPLQLFAYYVSKARGLDVDKPRNLAKSVTVE